MCVYVCFGCLGEKVLAQRNQYRDYTIWMTLKGTESRVMTFRLRHIMSVYLCVCACVYVRVCVRACVCTCLCVLRCARVIHNMKQGRPYVVRIVFISLVL